MTLLDLSRFSPEQIDRLLTLGLRADAEREYEAFLAEAACIICGVPLSCVRPYIFHPHRREDS